MMETTSEKYRAARDMLMALKWHFDESARGKAQGERADEWRAFLQAIEPLAVEYTRIEARYLQERGRET